MRPYLAVILTLSLAPLLVSRQQHKSSFAECDKTAKTQADLTECASEDYKRADNELNRIYQHLLAKAAGDPVAVEKIKAAQRAWVAFRDAQIAAIYPAENPQRKYGTVFPMCANLALSDLTKQRTEMLKRMITHVEGDVCR
jgi:uncharacterized protein YecT (DUF1311 family)